YRAEVEVHVERKGFRGTITVDLVAAPKGVMAKSLTLSPEESRGKLVLDAANVADLVEKTAVLRARAQTLNRTRDVSVNLRMAANPDELKRFKVADKGESVQVCFVPKGSRAVTSGRDGKLRVWDIGLKEVVEDSQLRKPPIRALAVPAQREVVF